MVENSTDLSVPGVIKWVLIIGACPCLIKAYQGLVNKKTATGYGSIGASRTNLLLGDDAVKFGWENLGMAALFLAAAWAIWFFWQQHED